MGTEQRGIMKKKDSTASFCPHLSAFLSFRYDSAPNSCLCALRAFAVEFLFSLCVLCLLPIFLPPFFCLASCVMILPFFSASSFLQDPEITAETRSDAEKN